MEEKRDVQKEVEVIHKAISDFYHKRALLSEISLRESESQHLSISDFVLNSLHDLGFRIEEKGTHYLAEVIEELYHERKIFDGNRKYIDHFFDFDDEENNHYSFANEYFECGRINLVSEIYKSMKNSNMEKCSLNDVVYGVANDVINMYDKSGKRLVLKLKK